MCKGSEVANKFSNPLTPLVRAGSLKSRSKLVAPVMRERNAAKAASKISAAVPDLSAPLKNASALAERQPDWAMASLADAASGDCEDALTSLRLNGNATG